MAFEDRIEILKSLRFWLQMLIQWLKCYNNVLKMWEVRSWRSSDHFWIEFLSFYSSQLFWGQNLNSVMGNGNFASKILNIKLEFHNVSPRIIDWVNNWSGNYGSSFEYSTLFNHNIKNTALGAHAHISETFT